MLAGFSYTMQSRKVIRCIHEAREACVCLCVFIPVFFDTMFCVLFSALFCVCHCAVSSCCLSLVTISYHATFLFVLVPVLWTNCQ